MTTIDQLSDSMLKNVFFRVIGNNPAILPPRPHEIRLVLSQVSPRWRAIMLENAIFWANIHLLPKPVHRPDFLKATTKLWLRRGKAAGLNLVFRRAGGNYGNPQEEPTLAYEVLFAHGMVDTVAFILIPFGPNIRSLNWTVCTERAIKDFLFIPPGTFKRLESVRLTIFNEFYRHETYFSDLELKSFTVFQGLENLRSAVINILNGIKPFQLKLPLDSLVILDLGDTSISPQSFMNIIRRSAPSLVEGFFNIIFTKYSKYDPQCTEIKSACGSRIETLRLKLLEPSKDERLFTRLTLPSLYELRIDLYDPVRGWKPSLVTSILKRSSETLETLMLSDHFPDNTSARRQRCMHHQELEQLFEAVPNIRALSLSFGLYIYAVTLEKIATGKLLPQLDLLSHTSLNALHVLSIARRRNELADYSLLLPGSSNQTTTGHSFLSPLLDIIMVVPRKQKFELDEEVELLQRISHLGDSEVDIAGEDISNFL